jgi:hypothetical protein
MAFLFDQRTRLLRESWTADALAQEIYAMISADTPANTQGPVSISLPKGATVAPITIGNNGPDNPVFDIKRPGLPDENIFLINDQWFIDNGNGQGKQPMFAGGGSSGGQVVPVWG